MSRASGGRRRRGAAGPLVPVDRAGLRVLIVDDNPDDRALTLRLLQQEFGQVRAFEPTNAVALDDALQRGGFDVVVTDFQLHWTDGLRVLHAVKQRHPFCPIVMMTGTGSEEIACEAMKAGLDDYVIKSHKHAVRLPSAVRAALEHAQQRTAAQAAQARLRSLFDGLPAGLYRVTPGGDIVDANLTFARLLGFADREAMRGAHALDHYLNAEDRQHWVEQMERDGMVQGFEVQVRRKDGATIWVRDSAHVVRDPEGRTLYYEGIIEEITEWKKLEDQLRQAQRLEAIGRLAGGISHDFNNLLTAILGYCDLLLNELPVGQRSRADVEEIRGAAERAANLTRQLLAFSRRQILEPRVIDLNGVVGGMINMLRRLIGERIDLSSNLWSEVVPVRADPGQLEQVIINLVLNARDAMPNGGKLTIETQLLELEEGLTDDELWIQPGRYAMLSVSDTGVGMDQETLSHIYEPFYTTKPPGHGTGLGLATVYGIIKQSGGQTHVYSEPGAGTTFKVYLPWVDQPVSRLAAPAVNGEPKGGSETVMLVEDDDKVRDLAKKSLERRGYQVLEARNGTEALALLDAHHGPLDLLITDVMMPEMGGDLLAARVTELRPDVRVLFLSGYTDSALVHRAVLQESVAFLQKPFTPSAIARKAREVLDAGLPQA